MIEIDYSAIFKGVDQIYSTINEIYVILSKFFLHSGVNDVLIVRDNIQLCRD
jgi:hypothetical protein